MKLKYIGYGVVAVIALALGMTGCTQVTKGKEQQARNAIEAQGIEVSRMYYSFFGCSEDDQFRFGFEGYNTQTKKPVKGVACSGWVKGTTIRFQ